MDVGSALNDNYHERNRGSLHTAQHRSGACECVRAAEDGILDIEFHELPNCATKTAAYHNRRHEQPRGNGAPICEEHHKNVGESRNQQRGYCKRLARLREEPHNRLFSGAKKDGSQFIKLSNRATQLHSKFGLRLDRHTCATSPLTIPTSPARFARVFTADAHPRRGVDALRAPCRASACGVVSRAIAPIAPVVSVAARPRAIIGALWV
mmetsp:Transcript_15421/g.24630  ORF Transcript_15421/g.24630 Transcript_15421/m.24630 type:complete len:209 (+) Transcript_15421:1082-1708(+)